MIIEMMNRKEHLTMEGLQQIVNIMGALINEGLSLGSKAAFPNTIKVQRPLKCHKSLIRIDWLVL